MRVLIVCLICTTMWLIWLLTASSNDRSLLTPLSIKPIQPAVEKSPTHMLVFGFWPYWNFQQKIPIEMLTDVAFFDVSMTEDGRLKNSFGPHDFGSDRVTQAEAQIPPGVNKHLVITNFDSAELSSFLGNETAQERAIERISNLMIEKSFQGINIDFEPNKSVDSTVSAGLTKFTTQLRHRLSNKKPGSFLSINVYAHKSNLYIWDLADLHQTVDYIVVMAYDYHGRTSQLAGPIAPLRATLPHSPRVMEDLKTITSQVPAHKIVYGVANYGYQWQTLNATEQSTTYPKSWQMVTDKEVADFFDTEQNHQAFFNVNWLSPWIAYEKAGKNYQIHYENVRSWQYKAQLIEQAQFAGVGIWALGYDNHDFRLWRAFEHTVKQHTMGH